MARFQIKHGENIEVATLSEIQALLAEQRAEDRRSRVRVRATETLKLDAGGSGTGPIYGVPAGYEFEVRRVMLDIDVANAPNSGNIDLTIAGVWIAYQRSGARIEYASPSSVFAHSSIPGVQTWGAEQGPYLVNGEAFEVKANGLAAGNGILTVEVEGILARVKAQ